MPAIVRRAESYRGFRARADDSTYFACIIDPLRPTREAARFHALVEIYPHGGLSDPEVVREAQELMFVLKGKARARCEGEVRLLETGDTLMVPPGAARRVENVGPGKLYTLNVLAPECPLAAWLHGGVPAPLDEEDLGVLRRLPLKR